MHPRRGDRHGGAGAGGAAGAIPPCARSAAASFYGTGDIFASAFAALLTRGAPVSAALEAASSLVADSIERTYLDGTPRRDGVAFELSLPAYMARVREVFGEHGA